MNPVVSIIVPVYRVEPYLDKCIESIVNQTYANLEIILVDDGSPDRCSEMCDAWASRDSRIRVIHQHNQGLSAARNAGIDAAVGEILLFVDSDDYIAQETCECIVDAYQRTGADIVVFNVKRVDENGVVLELTENLQKDLLCREEALRKLFTSDIHDYFPNKAYKHEIFSEIKLPVGRYFEDIGTMYKLFLNAQTVCTLPEPFYYYVKRANSTIGTMSDKALCDCYEMRREQYEDMKKYYPEIAELSFHKTIISALRLYDRSLWSNVNKNIVDSALEYLQNNKEKALNTVNDYEVRLYYASPKLYVHYRLAKHSVGNVVKALRRWKSRM